MLLYYPDWLIAHVQMIMTKAPQLMHAISAHTSFYYCVIAEIIGLVKLYRIHGPLQDCGLHNQTTGTVFVVNECWTWACTYQLFIVEEHFIHNEAMYASNRVIVCQSKSMMSPYLVARQE